MAHADPSMNGKNVEGTAGYSCAIRVTAEPHLPNRHVYSGYGA